MLADRNEEASFVYFPGESDKAGLATLILYIPCTENAEQLLVCPGVASLEEVTEDCSDSVTLTPDETIGDYWWSTYAYNYSEAVCTIVVNVANLGNGFGAKEM